MDATSEEHDEAQDDAPEDHLPGGTYLVLSQDDLAQLATMIAELVAGKLREVLEPRRERDWMGR